VSDADDAEIVDTDTDAGDDEVDDGHTIPAATATAVTEYIVKALVEEPDGVDVDVIEGRRTTIEVRVAPGDMGRVIGKRGRVAQSIRAVVRAAAVRDGVDVDVEFME
jgi:predicted RNA-binding protein YlqC (UPF0109 family)